MNKKKIIPVILTLVAWFIMFYVYLPPINIKSNEFWQFMVIAVVVALILNMWSVLKGITFKKNDEYSENNHKPKKFKIAFGLVGLIVIVYIAGNILSSPIIRASSYSELLNVSDGNFEEDIDEINYSKIPILDKDSAAILAERKMGSMVDMVSQYEVSDYYSQINYNQKPVRVTPLEYASEIKWLTNRKTGIPAYIRIDMTTQDVELVKLDEGIKYSPSEHFGRDLMRYIRFRYPTAMFRGMNFEIDDNGTPYWICPVIDHTIGLFGGTDVKGAVLVNAVNGEHKYYDIKDVPQWIDKVYDAELLIEQYDYYGKLRNGFINSVFGQRDCLRTTEGYNYMALDDDVWVYTGVTSVSGDLSNVGFVLMNQRTKETKYYQISGAEEFSAMSSAEGQVQHLGYKATFPLLLNVAGEPTYFLALKDGAGLVKMYAMVNIEKYQTVAIGETVESCEKTYKSYLKSNGIVSTDVATGETVSGTIEFIKDAVIEGNTCYFIKLSGIEGLYSVYVKDNIDVITKNIGDTVNIEYVPTEKEGVYTITSIK